MKLSCYKLIFTLILAAVWSAAGQSVPAMINYQGRLTDGTGVPLSAGTYAIAFRVWDRQSAAAGETLVWGQEYDVAILTNGAFNLLLGTPGGRALTDSPAPAVNDLALSFGGPNRFLGLTIVRDAGGQTVVNPKELDLRQQLLSVPFALQTKQAASVAAGSIETVSLSNGSVTHAKLAARTVSSNAPAGGVAISAAPVPTDPTKPEVGFKCLTSTVTAVPGLDVTLETTGRPVFLALLPEIPSQNRTEGPNIDKGEVWDTSTIWVHSGDSETFGHVYFVADQQQVAMITLRAGSVNHYSTQPGSLSQVILLPAGIHSFSVQVSYRGNAPSGLQIHGARLMVYEL